MESINKQGPLLNDSIFFKELLNLEFKGLESIKESISKNDYKACRKIFADFFRGFLEPEKFFTTLPEGGKVEDDKFLIEKASEACRHYVVCCDTPYDFKGQPIDWNFNPTFNNYKEWPFVLNRHHELLTLAKAFRATKDEKYAYACQELLDSWLKTATAPPEGTMWGDTNTWRTLECGIRLCEVWPEIIHSLYKTDAFTDDLIVDICKSVWEQGRRVRYEHRDRGNWLIYAMSGLSSLCILFPFLKDSEDWFAYALESLRKELKRQVHPDGFQFELSTSYQYDVAVCFINVLKLMKAYGCGYDENIAAIVEKLLETYTYLTMPNGKVPDINDGAYFITKDILSPYADIFPENPLIKWAVTNGKEGCAPPKSHIFRNAGLGVTRTGFSENDTYVFFDGGEYAAGHQHEDKLNLLMYADGKMTLTEGGNYAYDTSDMRLYVRSTKAHNTVLVDNLNQNRGINYKFPDTEKISDLKENFSDKIDAFSSFYCEGYGENAETAVRHERKVYFIKKEKGLKPFTLVADRLISLDEKEHLYSFLWHLDCKDLSIKGNKLRADTLNLAVSDERLKLNVISGQLSPEIQGFICSCSQLQYRPIHCAELSLKCDNLRLITLFYPDGGEICPIERIEASSSIDNNEITLIKTNGEKITYNESDLI